MYKRLSIQHKVTKEELFIVSGNFFHTYCTHPSPITSHHFATHMNISHKLAFFLPKYILWGQLRLTLLYIGFVRATLIIVI
jgi:hypothetical protein